MKNIHFFLLILIGGIIIACDGGEVDNPYALPNYCYFQPQVISSSASGQFDITFTFKDNLGDTYDWGYSLGSTLPLMSLPKNRCYDAWITDIGTGRNGNITYSVYQDDALCFLHTERVDERGDIISSNNPDFSFCLNSSCDCPNN